MSLRTKLLLAQVPLAIALALIGAMSYRAVSAMGLESQSILKDNFRSVLDAQQMRDAIARLDRDGVNLALGSPARAPDAAAADETRFETALLDQEANITEVGEADATHRLRQSWDAYRQASAVARAHSLTGAGYATTLRPLFEQTLRADDEVQALNMDAMARKNEDVRRQVSRYQRLLVGAISLASIAGLVLSAAWMARLLRPLGVLRQAVRRVGEGDLDARVSLPGSDELAAIARDFNVMTDRMRAYRQSSLGDLIQAQEAAQAAMDSLPDPILLLDSNGAVVNVNQAARTAFTIPEDIISLRHLETPLLDAVERTRTYVLAGKGPYVPKGFEEAVPGHTAEGERFFLVRASPVYAAEGGVAGAAVILQDVTRLRLFDELKNDLVATVAHEFRSPLTSLRMAIHLCLEEVAGPLTEKQRDVLYAAREDCERLHGMVEDLLDVARIQSGRLELARRPLSVKDLLEQVSGQFRREAEERHLSLRVEPAPEGVVVSVDPERIQLVFSNLLNNAIHFTPAGGQVEVRVLPKPGWVRFEVSDTGPGVPEEYQVRIFEKFFQVPGAARGSAGLGLYIAREIVRGHGGEMGVESTVGRGSTFWFTLPAK